MTKERIENLENRIATLTKKLDIILSLITKKQEKENCAMSGEQSSLHIALDSNTLNSA